MEPASRSRGEAWAGGILTTVPQETMKPSVAAAEGLSQVAPPSSGGEGAFWKSLGHMGDTTGICGQGPARHCGMDLRIEEVA